MYASEIESQALANCIAFTNAALGSASNPSQSFAVVTKDANGNFTKSWDSSNIYMTVTINSGQPYGYLFVYYTALVSQVSINSLLISSSSFNTNYNQFLATVGNSVYLNSSAKYIEMQVQGSPASITISDPSVPSSGGGGGGGFFTTSTSTTTQPNPISSSLPGNAGPINSAIGIVLIVLLVVVGIAYLRKRESGGKHTNRGLSLK